MRVNVCTFNQLQQLEKYYYIFNITEKCVRLQRDIKSTHAGQGHLHRHLHRRQPEHENSRTTNRIAIFRHTPPVATDSSTYTAHQTLVVALVLSRLDYGKGVLVGLPAYLVCQLQSVIDSSARMIFQLHRSNHITNALASLHTLCVPERNQFKITVLAYNVLHGTASCYLGPLLRVFDFPGWRCLCSASTDCLVVRLFKLSTIGSRTFKVAAAQTLNGMPEDVKTSPTLPMFRKT